MKLPASSRRSSRGSHAKSSRAGVAHSSSSEATKRSACSTRPVRRSARPIGLQERFVEETLADPEVPLTVGIGLDAGAAVEVEGGYRGGALNLAARLCGQARAGEILASREVTHLARRLDGVSYQDRGTMSLKGLDEPVAVVRVVPDDLDAVERLSPFAAAPAPAPARCGDGKAS